MLGIHWGTTRVVVVCGSIAVKFPRGEAGIRGNKFEGQVWERYRDHPHRGARPMPASSKKQPTRSPQPSIRSVKAFENTSANNRSRDAARLSPRRVVSFETERLAIAL